MAIMTMSVVNVLVVTSKRRGVGGEDVAARCASEGRAFSMLVLDAPVDLQASGYTSCCYSTIFVYRLSFTAVTFL
ncbi:hypothetical protein BRADI_1g26815v3 [Brachypodium distachyon]|uniref:Uncharacterized protein n=1 Tax=Brachypodium distachyon TaxID=15368 RepID=A0A2K2DLA4_BRADI|nr:hypothetical protein BRADI_1g26815v3 [Brachypodium distachyon]